MSGFTPPGGFAYHRAMEQTEIYAMMADYMDKGFLDNIEDMLKHDRSLFSALPLMIIDERISVRIGAVALAETMRAEYMDELREQVPAIAEQLAHDNPTFRGDAIFLLSAIGHPDALPYLEAHEETHPQVRQMLEETLKEFKGG